MLLLLLLLLRFLLLLLLCLLLLLLSLLLRGLRDATVLCVVDNARVKCLKRRGDLVIKQC